MGDESDCRLATACHRAASPCAGQPLSSGCGEEGSVPRMLSAARSLRNSGQHTLLDNRQLHDLHSPPRRANASFTLNQRPAHATAMSAAALQPPAPTALRKDVLAWLLAVKPAALPTPQSATTLGTAADTAAAADAVADGSAARDAAREIIHASLVRLLGADPGEANARVAKLLASVRTPHALSLLQKLLDEDPVVALSTTTLAFRFRAITHADEVIAVLVRLPHLRVVEVRDDGFIASVLAGMRGAIDAGALQHLAEVAVDGQGLPDWSDFPGGLRVPRPGVYSRDCDHDIRALAPALTRLPALRKLRLMHHPPSLPGTLALAAAMAHPASYHRRWTVLDLSGSLHEDGACAAILAQFAYGSLRELRLGAVGACAVHALARWSPAALRALQLADLRLQALTDEGVAVLAETLSDMQSLQMLSVAVERRRAVGINRMFMQAAQLPALTSLRLAGGALLPLEADELAACAHGFRQLVKLDLHALYPVDGPSLTALVSGELAWEQLRDVSITMDGVDVPALMTSLPHPLQRLDVSSADTVTPFLVKVADDAASEHWNRLEELNLSSTLPVTMSDGARVDAVCQLDAFLRRLQALRVLRFNNNSLPDFVIGIFSCSLGQLPLLRELHLCCCDIGDVGMVELDDSWPHLTQLEVLALSNNHLSVASMGRLSDAIAGMPALRELHLDSNPLGDAGVAGLRRGLAGTRTLQLLGLAGAMLTDDACATLAGVLPSMSKLQTLQVADNDITSAGQAVLAAALASLPELRMVCVYSTATPHGRAVRDFRKLLPAVEVPHGPP